MTRNRHMEHTQSRDNLNCLGALACRFKSLLVTCSLVLLAGCGKSDKVAVVDPNAGLPPEAVAVRQAFESSEPSYRYPVEDVLRLVKAGQSNPVAMSEALPMLGKLITNPTITPAQKQALEDLMQNIKSGGVKPAPQR
jgi:hypothetical protein